MRQTSLSKLRASYYHRIVVYKQRREKLRIKYGYKVNSHRNKDNEKYKKAIARMNVKIASWNKQISIIDKKTKKIRALYKAVAEFTGFRLREGYKFKREAKLAKGLYYKYGVENGMTPKHLREHIDMYRPEQPSDYRKWLTKEIVSNPMIRNKWENFKQYMKNS